MEWIYFAIDLKVWLALGLILMLIIIVGEMESEKDEDKYREECDDGYHYGRWKDILIMVKRRIG